MQAPEGLDLSEKIVFSLFEGDIDSSLVHHAEVCARNQKIAANRKAPSVTSRDESLPVAPNRTELESRREESTLIKPKDNNPPVPTAPARENPDLGRVMSFFLDRINPDPSPTCIDLLKQYTASLSADVVIHALEIAIDERKTAWSYIQAILSQYERDGIRDMDGVKRREQERQQRRETAAPAARRMSKSEEFAAAGRKQHFADLGKLVTDLDKI